MSEYKLLMGDCLELMKDIPDKSIDCIICDPPYNTTAAAWDKMLDFKALWKQYERIIKDRGAIVLFASGTFTHKLISSNESLYRYKWIWFKSKRGNFVNAKNRPMTAYEEICVFSKGVTANHCKNRMNYYPQGLTAKKTVRTDKHGTRFGTMCGKRPSQKATVVSEFTGYPCDVLQFKSVAKPIHSTEKPVDLLEYLVKTYTQEGDTILDNCMGAGTTGIAAVRHNRNFIGMELDKEYFNAAEARIYEEKNNEQS